MDRASGNSKGELTSVAGDRQTWQPPTVNKLSIKQITRGGMMVGADMMGMAGMMMNGS